MALSEGSELLPTHEDALRFFEYRYYRLRITHSGQGADGENLFMPVVNNIIAAEFRPSENALLLSIQGELRPGKFEDFQREPPSPVLLYSILEWADKTLFVYPPKEEGLKTEYVSVQLRRSATDIFGYTFVLSPDERGRFTRSITEDEVLFRAPTG